MVVGGADLFNLDLLKRVDKKKYLEAALELYPDDAQTKRAYEQVCIEIKELMGRRDSYEAAQKLYEIKDEIL